MSIYKNTYIRTLMTLFTGVIFFNMSFFLVEVAALKLNKDRKMIANIAKLISASSSEEEKDAFGGAADEDCSAKEVDLIYNYTIHNVNHDIVLKITKKLVHDPGSPLLMSYEIYSPPPEV